MKKKILYVIGLVVLLAAIGVGLTYVYRNSGTRLLEKARLAYKTGNYDRAVDLADKYIGENNRDWNGFYVKAQGLSGQDRFDEARKALEQAGRLNAQDASIPTLAAQTYVAEARKVTQAGSEARLLSPKRLLDVEGALKKLNVALQTLRAVSEPARSSPELLEELSRHETECSDAQQLYARLLDEDLRTTRDVKVRQARPGQIAQAKAASTELLVAATADLLRVVEQDPDRSEDDTRLLQLCFDRQDDQSLQRARAAIRRAKTPPPVATMLLEMNDLQSFMGEENGPVNQDKIHQACQVLDDLLGHYSSAQLDDKAQQEVNQVKLVRASLDLKLDDVAGTRKLCQEVIATDKRNPRARLMLAEVMVRDNDPMGAKRELVSLRRDYPRWPDAAYTYARVALLVNQPDVAHEALSEMTRSGSTATGTRLLEAELAMILSDLPMARQLVQQVLAVEPQNGRARLLEADIQAQIGDLDQAQAKLKELVAQYPKWAQAQLVLAQVASQTRETDTAMAAAREAVKLDPQNAASRKLLTTLLQGDSKFESAFDEAKTCLTAHGDDPTAIRLYVEAAERVNHSDLALTMLDKAAQTYSSRAEVLMAVAEGYSTLNQRDKAVRAADKARQCVAETVAARLAVVRACRCSTACPRRRRCFRTKSPRSPRERTCITRWARSAPPPAECCPRSTSSGRPSSWTATTWAIT